MGVLSASSSGLSRGRAECDVLPAVAATFGADAVCLYEIDRDLNAGDHRLFNLDPDSLRHYQQHFARFDPLHPRNSAATGADVVRLCDVISGEKLMQSEYFRHFMRPFRMRDEIEVLLRENGRPVTGLSIIRSADRRAFDVGDVAWARAALPMLRLLVQGSTVSTASGDIEQMMRDAYGLTARELEIVGMLKAGLSNKAIAKQLGIGLSTVKTHMHRVFAKLNVASRAALVAAFLS